MITYQQQCNKLFAYSAIAALLVATQLYGEARNRHSAPSVSKTARVQRQKSAYRVSHHFHHYKPQQLAHPQPKATAAQKPWTVLVYMARDNSLSDDGTLNMNQMMTTNNPNVNILVYDCHKLNGVKEAQKVVITNGKATVLETTPNVDSGLEDTFLAACQWALNDFPSDKVAIIAWDHGSGPLNRSSLFHTMMRGFCYDDTTGSYLNDVQLMDILNQLVQARNGKKIDYFGFDACLMADVEILAALAPYVVAATASQQTIPGEGYPYDQIFTNLTSSTRVLDFARQIVTAYNNFYASGQESYTLTAFDLSSVALLNGSINSLSHQLAQMLQNDSTGAIEALIAQNTNSFFEEPTYMDFITFCAALQNNLSQMNLDSSTQQQLSAALNACISSATKIIVSHVASNDLSSATGLSIYFPQTIVEPSYEATYFAQQNAWDLFINQFINGQTSVVTA